MTQKIIDHLTNDPLIDNQQWVCMSFVSPEGIKNCTLRALKIRGVFATREEADTRAKYLQSIDPDFHVFVGEVGKWLPWDPEPTSVDNNQYREDELNTLMSEYKKTLANAQQTEAERKRSLLTKESLTKDPKVRLELQKERMRNAVREKQEKVKAMEAAKERLAQANIEARAQQPTTDPELDAAKKLADAESDRLKAANQALKERETDLETTTQKLEKIKSLFNKIQTKKQNQ